ncbi:hypothetical protein [Desulfosporosinus sp. FKA]|uniref:hypothetical protein n=1 Tax=Desulfosporosinus sp. FKA TaxID=1969834 RepID=UPI000B4994AA|nr:hypothetical protein [Desulfosporosinus sp. FKA]
MEFLVGDIILVHGDSLISKMISGVENSKYTHTAGLVRTNELIESNWNGVQWQALDYYSGNADVFRCPMLTNEKRLLIPDLAIKELHNPYDYELLGVQLFRYWLHVKLPYSEGKKRECSTLWSRIYKELEIDLCPGVEFPSPKDLGNSELLYKVGSL